MPRFSIIVPTHDSRWLCDTLRSVSAQTFRDFELVLVPNGTGLTLAKEVFDLLASLPAHRISPYTGTVGQVGAIKRHGFDAASGECLVELDHDDLLTPNCLEALNKEFSAGAEFVYCNTTEFHDETWKPHIYGAYFGWKTRPVHLFGHDLLELVAFDPMPSSVCYVWWSANHVRAWSRKIYDLAGGHNPELQVGDDHDLVIRTFLACVDWPKQFRRHDASLYLQRMHSDSTTHKVNGVIQKITHSLYAKHIQAIVQHWAKAKGFPCYDLGGAHACPAGWSPVDRAISGVDLREKWPWPDSSVGAFRASHFLEHLPDRIHTMSEIHRCLVPGGWLLSETPSSPGIGADCDPTHVSAWNRRSFLYWTDSSLAKYIANTTVKFQRMRLQTDTVMFKHPFFSDPDPVPVVKFDGIAIKDGWRGPGEIRI